MAVAYKGAGAGVSTQTSAADLSPAFPATVDAGDIALLFTGWEGTSNTPNTPAVGDGWVPLVSAQGVGSASTVARVWVFGKICDGTEDGATVALGNPSVGDMRCARIFTFSGRTAGG